MSEAKADGLSMPDRFEAMMESAQDSIISIDSTGIITYWNRASERMFGYQRSQAVGQSIALLIPERYLAAHSAGMSRVRNSGHSEMSGSTVELVGLRSDGTEFPLEMSLSHSNQNGFIHFTSIIRDISEKKAYSEKIVRAQAIAEQELQRRIVAEEEVRFANEQLESRVRERTLELEEARDLAIHHEQRTHSILKQIPAAVATVRASDMVYTSVNPQFSALHGHRSLVGHSVYSLNPSAESLEHIEKLKEVIASGTAVHENEASRRIDRNGHGAMEELIVNLVYDPVCDCDGIVVEIIIFCFDVTELVHGRREIEQRESRFRTLSEALPQIVWTSDLQGKILYFNPQWFEYTGLNEGDPSEFNWSSVIHPDDLQTIQLEAARCSKEGRGFEAEYRLKRWDGSYRWHLGRSLTIDSAEGKESRRIGTATDIHDQKETQKTMSVLRNRTDAIIQDAPVLLWAVDHNGIFTYYDGKVKNALGIRTEERIGKNILELYRGNLSVAGNVERALKGETVYGDSQIGSVSLENKFTPQFDQDGNITGVIGLSVDITDRKKAEQGYAEASISARIAQESSKLKSEFLANMSHEIRTPINGVIGMSGLLLDLVSRDEEKRYVTAIQRSGENLLSLVNDILDFSKIEAGKLDFEEREFALADVVSGLTQTLAFTVEGKGLQLTFQLGATIPPLILGDSGRFRQVLLNLISNAIKFTKEGMIQVRIEAEELSGSQVTLRVEVSDSGIGISPDTLTRLFQPFVQADASTARSYGGSGLGLSISKSLVERMGGRIGAVSNLGIGSTFWFTARFQIVEPSAMPKDSAASPLLSETLEARILVAEDNGINQIIAIKMLEKMGFTADIVANGHEVLHALESNPYDLILMDCQMPEMDGYEATRVIRSSLESTYSQIPIIAMTANAMRGDAEKCLASGMSDYISKPVKPADLLDKIRRNLSKAISRSA